MALPGFRELAQRHSVLHLVMLCMLDLMTVECVTVFAYLFYFTIFTFYSVCVWNDRWIVLCENNDGVWDGWYGIVEFNVPLDTV